MQLEDKLKHLIDCSRYGGKRFAPACVHFDRYRSCRRKCKDLEQFIKDNPTYLEIVKENYKPKEKLPAQISFFSITAKHTGKNLPDFSLACHICKFVGKTERGLKVHLKRTHKVSKPKAVPPSAD